MNRKPKDAERLEDVHISSFSTLPTPAEVKRDYPVSAAAAATTAAARQAIRQVLRRESNRFVMVAGPCSVHHPGGALDYARRLKSLAGAVADRMLVVMRVYVEKPRTTVGWKGLIYDPDLDGSCDIAKGLHLARRLMLDIAGLGLPVGTEVLDPVIPQYLADLIAWGVIGARTTESQTHRQLVSGLSMPTGFKNPTDGNIRVAIEAITTAAAPHSFLGVTSEGRSGFFRTTGNRDCHLILRGGTSGPNYGAEHVAYGRVMMEKLGIPANIMIDCSHANSGKSAERQADVLADALKQVAAGERAIVGAMLESYLRPGRQDIGARGTVKPDISVTDECIGWEETESLVRKAYETLGKRKR